jgi:PAS domain S-box-containing protein
MKREQVDLRETRERFAQVFEEAPAGMVFIAAGHMVRGRFLGANRAFRELLGYSEEQLLEKDILSVTHPDDVPVESALAHDLFEGQRPAYELDKRFERADGQVVWARFRAHVLRDERGAPVYGLGVAVDISAEKAALGAAADAGARAHALLESTPDAVVEVAADGTVADLNDAALRMLGLDRREAEGSPVADTLVAERLRPRFAEALADWQKAAREERAIEPTETTMTRADGSEFPAAVTITPVAGADPPRLTLYVRNLGVYDRAEAARREAEERFRRLFRDAPAAVVLIDLDGRLTDVNPAFCKLAARTPAELIGRDATDVLRDSGDAHEAPWQAGAERPGPLFANRRVERADGRSTTVQITASLVRDDAGAPVQWICQCTPPALTDTVPLPDGEPLSYRERQVLGLLARGHDGPAIADRLGLAPETIRSYAGSAREKMGAKTRTEAVALALARGEITL